MEFLVKIIIGLLLVSSVALGLSCAGGKEKPRGQSYLEPYFANLSAGNLDSLVAFYGPEFFAGAQLSPEELREQLAAYHEETGALHDVILRSWTEQKQNEGGLKGLYYILNYSLTYSDAETEETFIVHQDHTTGRMVILNRNVMKMDKRNR